ncbi:MAG: threonylcarbamoyl-AMP synthase [Holophagales bacterium]|nr:threonylcarbamoyl-AMP synthase [Holophagales bacterium]
MLLPPTPAALRRAAAALKRGEPVAFPTETVYGLGANALDPEAVRRIFEAKGRPDDNPLIVHVTGLPMARRLVKELPPEARALAARFWPGPLTIVLPKRRSVPDIVTAGLPTVAVRVPDHPVALALIEAAGVPIAAPSANRSGRPSPTRAAHVAADFPGLLVLDGGPARHGLESTVVALGDPPRVLRLGAIPFEELRKVLPDLVVATKARARAESPGMRHRHYAPARPLVLFRRSRAALREALAADPKGLLLCADADAPLFPGRRPVKLGGTPVEIAHGLFDALRTERHGSVLLAYALPRRGLLRAVMDRLERAAIRIV